MVISVRPQHLKRYKDLSLLLVKYGRSDLVREAGLVDVAGDAPPATVADGKPEELAADLERLGPTYIKLGQMLSTRGDLLPPAYIDALSRLQDDVAPFGFDEVEQIVSSELGVRISRAFQEFDNIPLASASLGQVHRAVLRNGRQVAVKVQRPGIREGILDDLDALRELAQFADSHFKVARRYGFAGMLDEFRKSMLRELDYQQEARNLQTLGANLARFPRIHVPQPVLDYTTTRVLTMDFIGGAKLTSLGPLAQLEVDGPELAHDLLSSYLQQILVDGFFHADPHPGNVFITEQGDIALIDLGMIGRVPPEVQEHLVRLLLGISDGRGDDAARALLEIAIRDLDEEEEVDEASFRRRIGEIVVEHQTADMSQIRAGAIILEMSRASVQSGLRPPPELSMLGRALLALDEVGRTLDPRFDPNETIRRQAAEIVRGRISSSTGQGSVFSALLEARDFVEHFPGRVNRVMDALAQGEMKLNVRGVDEREIMRGLHQVANRITAGVIIAALIIGAAMLTRVETSVTILGYPALAIVCFLAAAGFGFVLLVNIWRGDRRTARQARRR